MGVCQALRQALRSGEPVVAPLCYDPLTGKLVEYLGLPAAYLGGGALGYVLDITEAMMTLEEARQLPKEIHKPVVYMLSIAGDRPPFSLQELYAMGYPLIIEAQGGLMMAYGAMCKAYRELKETGRISCGVGEIKMIRDEINDPADLPKYWELEARTRRSN
jgi:2-methylisocitrate lyase-like PEP mutase family enzyme